MKKQTLLLVVSMLVGITVGVGLFYVLPGWTRADMLSVMNLAVTVWLVAVTRWATIPQGELARKQLEIAKKEEEESIKGRLEAQVVLTETGSFKLYVANTGSVSVTEIEILVEPEEDENRPVQLMISGEMKWNLLKGGEKRIVGIVSLANAANGYFHTRVSWKCPDGTVMQRDQTFTE